MLMARETKKRISRIAPQTDTQPKPKKVAEEDRVYTCVLCGNSTKRPGDQFYRTKDTILTEQNNGYAHICKTCINDIYKKYYEEFDSPVIAVQICCHYLDIPYVDRLAHRVVEQRNNTSPLTTYMQGLTASVYRNASFIDYIIDVAEYTTDLTTTSHDASKDKKWDQDSLKNMAYVKNIAGYDPFRDVNLSSEDRKFLFNTMAGYCPDSSVANDSHKFNCIINIVKLLLQSDKIGRNINFELTQPISQQKNVDKLINMQKVIQSSIDRIAKENDISRSTAAKGSNTLTMRMKQLNDEGFRESEVNMFNVEQSKQMQLLADISAQAVLKAINMEDNDYSMIISEQRDELTKLYADNKALQEQVRTLTNELNDRKGGKAVHEDVS